MSQPGTAARAYGDVVGGVTTAPSRRMHPEVFCQAALALPCGVRALVFATSVDRAVARTEYYIEFAGRRDAW